MTTRCLYDEDCWGQGCEHTPATCPWNRPTPMRGPDRDGLVERWDAVILPMWDPFLEGWLE